MIFPSIHGRRFRFRPGQTLILGFLGVILTGALLLTLPLSSATGQSIGFFKAIFTSTSATCVTGMMLLEITDFSLFGQIIILLLIQIGGLGFMTAALTLFFATGRRVTLRGRLALQEALNENSLHGLIRLGRRALVLTLAIEGVGFLILSIRFFFLYGPRGIWYGLFHTISAFCNAGFDLAGADPLSAQAAADPIILITTSLLVILGGLGFVVIYDLLTARRYSRLNTHSKLALCVTGILLVFGMLFFLLAEYRNTATLSSMGFGQKMLHAWFLSASLRTAGFSVINPCQLTAASLLLSMLLIFIGASPASTGGGVKTTTLGILFLSIRSLVSRRSDVEFAQRRILPETLRRAVAIVTLYVTTVMIFTLVICLTETPPNGPHSLADILYEVVNAFSTTGLSMGITRDLHISSQVMLMLGMFIGRLGPLTMTIAFVNKSHGDSLRYPEGRVMIG